MLTTIHWFLLLGSYGGIITFAAKNAVKKIPPAVHAFFYIWYGTPEFDGDYTHWNHEVLGHWNHEITGLHKEKVGKKHSPPDNLHSAFYPLQNAYSSKDPVNLDSQFSTMHEAGIDVAVVSWWGQPDKYKASDTQGVVSDLAMHHVFQSADRIGKVKVAIHLEPYHGRDEMTIRSDLEYIMTKYSNYTSFYRSEKGLPLYYVYDSYHIGVPQWQRLLQPRGDITLRNTAFDGIFLGLWLDGSHGKDLKDSGFDGAYSYFASEGFSYGSSTKHWKSMVFFCEAYGMLSSLSVGPGYDDTAIRPWNYHNAKHRDNGRYYEAMWEEALHARPSFVSITSYNEWGEGTQIEPAKVMQKSDGYSKFYQNYGTEEGGGSSSHKYIKLTAEYAKRYHQYKSEKLLHEEL